MIRLGYAKRVSGKLHLLRERITDAMIAEIISKKREFDNLRHDKHVDTAKQPALFPMKAPRPETNAGNPIAPAVVAPAKVGIVRRFIQWLW